MVRKMKTTRKFGKEHFRFAGVYSTKDHATDRKKWLKKQGLKVRIVKLKDGYHVFSHG